MDGSITITADKYNGKRLNSPNDAVVTSDGAIWFTVDAVNVVLFLLGFGLGCPHRSRLRGHQGDRPDEKKLYVIDTGFTAVTPRAVSGAPWVGAIRPRTGCAR